MAQAYAQGAGGQDDGGFIRDTGIDLAQGALRLPGAMAGLADIPTALATGRTPVSDVTSAIGEATGFQPGEWAENLDQYQSQALQESQANVDEAFEGTGTAITEGRYGDALRGAGRGAVALASNPRALASTVFESVPSMIGGGVLGRGAQALSGVRSPLKLAAQQAGVSGTAGAGRAIATGQAARQAGQEVGRRLPNLRPTPRLGGIPAAGIGEGAIMAGMAMDNMSEDVDPQRAAAASLGIGVGGGLLGVGGGALAQRLGVVNPEQAVMGRAGRAGTELGRGRNLPARVAGGFVSEGLFEEMPQESLETVATNWAEGEPLFNNVPRAAIEGMMAGGVMGGAMNIRRPRNFNDTATLTGQPPATESTEEGGPQGPSPFQTQGADVADLMRYHRRLTQVATGATQHPDLQQSAIDRIEGVLSELDKRGIPREVVNEELAKKKYQDIEDQALSIGAKYRDAVQTNPQLARTYLEKIQGLAQQKQQLEQQYPRDTLLGPDFETAQALKEQPAAAEFFRTVQGERTNRLKPSAQKKLTEFREMEPERLLREIARDLEDGEVGAEVNKWAPLREAAARDRGFTEEDIRERQRQEFGPRESESQMPGENDPNPLAEEITDEEAELAASALTEGSDTEQALQERQAQDVSRETPPAPSTNVTTVTRRADPRWQALEQVANQSPATRDAVAAVGEAIGEMEAGINVGSALQRAGELYAQRRPNVRNPRQALDNAVKKLSPRLRSLTNNPDMPELTAQSIIDSYTRGMEAPGATDGTQLDGELIGERGSMRGVSSAGGTTNEADVNRIKQGILDELNAQITAVGAAGNVATATQRAEQWAAQNTENMQQETLETLISEIESARTAGQVSTAMRKARTEIVNTLTARQTDAAPPRPRRTPELTEQQRLERERMTLEAEQAAQQRQQARQQALTTEEFMANSREALAQEDSRRAGGKWNKRANAWWAEMVPDQPMMTWDDMVDGYTLEALNWVMSVEEIENDMQMEPDAKRDALRQLFEDFADGFASGQAQANPEGFRLLAGADAASTAEIGAATQGESGAAAAEGRPGPAVELDETNPGAEVVESRETQQQRSDRYATDPMAALAELREALDDLAIALQQAENERSTYDAKKLARIQKEANRVFNNIGESSPDAVAKAVYDTYEVVAPVAADRARDEALAEKERKRAEREERTRKVAPETFRRDGETYYVAKTGRGYANENAANLQRFSKRFKDLGLKPENLKVVELDGLPAEGGRFALQFVPEPSIEAKNYSLHMSKKAAVEEQTAEQDAFARNDNLIDLMITVLRRERQGGTPVSVSELAEMTKGLVPESSYLIEQISELEALARGQAVRVSFDDRFKPQNTNGLDPYGYYEPINEVLWINESLFRSMVMNQQTDLISDLPLNDEVVATTFAEVITHEMLHMGTINVVREMETDHPLRQELRDIRDDIVSYQRGLMTEHAQNPRWRPTGRQDYIMFRLELMTDVRESGQDLTHGELETITYGLTDDVMREALKNMPAYPNQQGRENQSMLRRFTDWVRGILRPGTSPLPVSESMYARVESLTNRLMEMDDGIFNDEITQDLGIVEDLWETVRDAERLVDTPFKDPAAQAIVDEFKPDMEAAIARAEDLQVEVMKATLTSALGNEQPETDPHTLMVQLQRALRDASMSFDAMAERFWNLPDDGSDPSLADWTDTTQARQGPRRDFKSYAAAYRQNRDFAPERSERQREWLDRMYDVLPGKLSDAAIATKDGIRNMGMLTMFTSQFVDYVKRWLPTVGDYYATIRYRISERNDIHTKIQETVGEVAHWSHKRRQQLNSFLAESTYRGKWGFVPDWIPNATVDPAMEERFERMDDDQQRVAKNMFKQAHLMHVALQKELRGDIERVYDESIVRATAPARVSKLQREKADALAAHDKRQENFRDAYLPLKRWGKWAVVYKSQAFKDAVARGNRKEIDNLKNDENHYMVAFADSQYAARQLRRDWEQEKGESIEDPFPRMRYDEQNELVPFDLLQRLKQKTADGTGIPQGVSTKLDEALNRVYIEALSESSVRKSELRRIGVRGFDEDMVRAFVQHGQGVASLTSAIRINWQTRQHIEQMKDEAQNPKPGQSRKDTMAALNEILARHAISLEPQDQGLQQKVMGFTSIWMLLTSPAYYIQNATQPFMMTLPQLAGEFGFNKSAAHMTKAYKDVGVAWNDTRQDETRQGDLMDPEKITDPYEREVIDELLGLNLLDVGIAADLGSLSEARTAPMRLLNGAHRRMVTGVRTVEVFNRGVTALAAYRLAYEKYSKNSRMTEANARRNAKDYAIRQVEDTQGDYGGPNAPRLINKIPAGRIVTQFRKFQLIQIGLLTRTLHRKFKGATAEERAIGKRQFRYILGVHAAIGGLTGLPAANLISMAVGMAFGVGEDDEPSGVEMRIRRSIGDKAISDLVLQGLPAWAGIDASNRLGMGLTLSILPFTDVDLTRDGFLTVAGSLALGPTGAVGASMFSGMGKFQNGDVLGGTADMLPSALKNSMKAYSYATEGIETRTGITAITAEELNWFDLASQAAGWPSKTISDRYEMYGMLLETEEFFRNRTGKIKRAYTEAYEAGDANEMAEARDEWRRLQWSRREYGVGQPQSLSELIKAPREKREKEAAMIGGVPTERTTRRFVQELFE